MTNLRPGVRVRTHLPAEPDQLDVAKGQTLACVGLAGTTTPVIGHVPQHEGRTGTVRECSGGFPCRFGAEIGHGYVVVYDQPYLLDGLTRWGGHFAENELEVLA